MILYFMPAHGFIKMIKLKFAVSSTMREQSIWLGRRMMKDDEMQNVTVPFIVGGKMHELIEAANEWN